MVDPIAVGQIKEYVLESDKSNPTIWLIGPLDSMTKSKILASFGKVEIKDDKAVYVRGDIDFTQNNFHIVKYGLKGARNWLLDGKEVDFTFNKEKVYNKEIDALSDEVLKMIPLFAINELASEIWGENQVSKELEKN